MTAHTDRVVQSDPRTKYARHHMVDSKGLVVGVETTVHTFPNTYWQCAHVNVLGEGDYGARGRTIIQVYVEDHNGDPVTNADVRLGTGYSGQPGSHDQWLKPGGTNRNPVEFNMPEGFTPPNLGPYSVVILGPGGRIDSDQVGNMGLSRGRHISFVIRFRPRNNGGSTENQRNGDIRSYAVNLFNGLSSLEAQIAHLKSQASYIIDNTKE